MTYSVKEIYYTIQEKGTILDELLYFAGSQAVIYGLEKK